MNTTAFVKKGVSVLLLTLLLVLGLSLTTSNIAAAASETTASTASSVKTLTAGKTWNVSGCGCAKVTSSKTSVAKVSKKANNKYKITARKKGQTILKFYNSNGELVKKVYLLVTNSGSFKYSTASVSLMAGKSKTVKATVQSGSYLSGYSQMRWNISGKSIMTDPDGYRNMSADEILKDLFASR